MALTAEQLRLIETTAAVAADKAVTRVHERLDRIAAERGAAIAAAIVQHQAACPIAKTILRNRAWWMGICFAGGVAATVVGLAARLIL